MDAFRVESVRIKAPFQRLFEYIADLQNLPEWTHAFKSVQNGKALMATPAGQVEVNLKVNSSRSEGTIDWHMKFPDGNEAAAYSRLVPDSSESCIYSFILLAPPVPLAQLEGTLNQQAEILRDELKRAEPNLGSGLNTLKAFWHVSDRGRNREKGAAGRLRCSVRVASIAMCREKGHCKATTAIRTP